MHDYLFEHQRALGDRELEEYAAALELDVERFDADIGPGLRRAGPRGLHERRPEWRQRDADLLHQRTAP